MVRLGFELHFSAGRWGDEILIFCLWADRDKLMGDDKWNITLLWGRLVTFPRLP